MYTPLRMSGACMRDAHSNHLPLHEAAERYGPGVLLQYDLAELTSDFWSMTSGLEVCVQQHVEGSTEI